MPSQAGWEEIADYALTGQTSMHLLGEEPVGAEQGMTVVRVTHIGAPTTLIQTGGVCHGARIARPDRARIRLDANPSR
jgi:hypothetical protein